MPHNVKRMVLAGPGQVRTAMTMLSVLGKLPVRNWLAAQAIAPIKKAARAIALPDYGYGSTGFTTRR